MQLQNYFCPSKPEWTVASSIWETVNEILNYKFPTPLHHPL